MCIRDRNLGNLYTNSLKLVILLSFLVFKLSLVNGQNCTIHEIDGGDSFISIFPSETYGQTFMSCQNGVITSLSLGIDASTPVFTNTYNLKIGIEPGAGNFLAGAAIATFNIVAADAGNSITINLPTPIPVTNGLEYRFEINSPSTNFGVISINVNSTSDFTDGNIVIANGTYFNSQDFDFSVNIENQPAVVGSPIPTISQWGLFIFGLLILNISVFFVQQRELV